MSGIINQTTICFTLSSQQTLFNWPINKSRPQFECKDISGYNLLSNLDHYFYYISELSNSGLNVLQPQKCTDHYLNPIYEWIQIVPAMWYHKIVVLIWLE